MTQTQPIICGNTNTVFINTPKGDIPIEDVELVKKIKAITARGNDVEIRPKRDGKLAIYEIKKKIV